VESKIEEMDKLRNLNTTLESQLESEKKQHAKRIRELEEKEESEMDKDLLIQYSELKKTLKTKEEALKALVKDKTKIEKNLSLVT